MAMLPLLLTVCLNSRLVVAGPGSHPHHLSREMEEVILPATTTSAATVCTTEEQCRQQFSIMSTGGDFIVGDFPTKGCFSKNGNVFFGIGSVVDEDMAETDLPGTQERIWCNSESEVSQSTTVPTMQPSSEALLPTIPPVDDGDGSFFLDVTGVPTLGQQSVQIPGAVCLTVDQCQTQFSSMSTGGEFIVGNFPTKGCFSKKSNIYFGTGSTTEEELAETELPGTQERIWCDGATEVPTTSPSVLRVTDSPSTQPTRMPVVLTASPSIQPTTGMPVTASPTKQLTSMPVTESPTSTPSSVLEEGTAPPSQLPINSTSPTLHSIIPPSVSPTTVSPITMAPSVDTVQETNDLSSQHKPTTSPTKAKTNSVSLTPFELSLQTAPGTNTVDTLELKDLVSIHLLETMEAALKSFETTKLDMNVTSISGQPSRRLQPSGLIFASDNTTSNTLDFTLSGIAYFSGSSVPTVKALDTVTLESFSGKSGDEFVHSLQNAEDAGLRSTRSVDAEISNNEEVNIVNQLTQAEDDDEVGNKRLSLLAIVFGVGLVLVAMHVMKSRRARKVELENRENAAYEDIVDEESPSESEFPTYIEVQKTDEKVNEQPWYDASCYMPWIFGSQPEATTEDVKKDVNIEAKPESPVEVPTTSDAAPDFDVVSTDKSKGLSETLSVFPKDLQTLSGESDTEERNEQNHGWELCGGYEDVEHTSGSNNDSSSSSEDQNRVTGAVWGQKPSDGALS